MPLAITIIYYLRHILQYIEFSVLLAIIPLVSVTVMGEDLDWSSPRAIATNLLDGNPIAILVTVILAFGLPVLLHYLLYRKAASPPRSTFILLGPSGAGKTSLFSLVSSLYFGNNVKRCLI
jgi:hypothetical protein